MPSDEFDELYARASRLGRLLISAYRDITGEDLDLEGAVRHYPLIALGLAAGAGALGGWWVARRLQPRLPPPKPKSQLDTAWESLRDFGTKFRAAGERAPGQGPATAWDYFEQLLPEGLATLKKAFPDANTEQAASQYRSWLDTVLDPTLKRGFDSVVANLSETKVGSYFREQMQRLESDEDTRLEDPEAPEKP